MIHTDGSIRARLVPSCSRQKLEKEKSAKVRRFSTRKEKIAAASDLREVSLPVTKPEKTAMINIRTELKMMPGFLIKSPLTIVLTTLWYVPTPGYSLCRGTDAISCVPVAVSPIMRILSCTSSVRRISSTIFMESLTLSRSVLSRPDGASAYSFSILVFSFLSISKYFSFSCRSSVLSPLISSRSLIFLSIEVSAEYLLFSLAISPFKDARFWIPSTPPTLSKKRYTPSAKSLYSSRA